jgi:hypothetical protein
MGSQSVSGWPVEMTTPGGVAAVALEASHELLGHLEEQRVAVGVGLELLAVLDPEVLPGHAEPGGARLGLVDEVRDLFAGRRRRSPAAVISARGEVVDDGLVLQASLGADGDDVRSPQRWRR